MIQYIPHSAFLRTLHLSQSQLFLNNYVVTTTFYVVIVVLRDDADFTVHVSRVVQTDLNTLFRLTTLTAVSPALKTSFEAARATLEVNISKPISTEHQPHPEH